MAHKKDRDEDDPKPLNFDHDESRGPSDHLKKPFLTPEDERGDNEDDQYYEMEEALSPEEVKKRKEEGSFEDDSDAILVDPEFEEETSKETLVDDVEDLLENPESDVETNEE
ncbi:hypothetical protein BN1013_01304 [Candidatus Rubidus massiliensis]|nr:hypothetical protein BN1013_01304 [Candidatus Rubidus massiliensis]